MSGQQAEILPSRKPRRLKTVALVLLGLAALCSACNLSLALILYRRIESIRRAGFPATCAELDKWYVQPPAGENAADIYREAFSRYESWTNKPALLSVPADVTDRTKFFSRPESKRDRLPVVGFAKLPPKTDPLPAETRQLVDDYLSDNAEALRLLHQAASMRSCRYPIDLTRGFVVPLSPLNSLRQAARLLFLEAIQETERKKPQQAVEAIIASLGVSRSLNQEPVLISYLVHIACQGINVDSLERVLNRMPLTDEQLAELDAAITDSENPQALTRVFVGERCCG